MNKLEQAARQAVEALEEAYAAQFETTWFEIKPEHFTALREVLAEPDIEEMTLTQIAARHEQAEQEPVAWLADGQLFYTKDVASIEPLIPLYATPVRTKYLTDDEIATVYEQDEHHHGEFNYRFDPVSFARAVITKFKEKNK